MEFVDMFKQEKLISKMLYNFGLISRQGGGEEIPEFDPNLDEEVLKEKDITDERIQAIKL